MKNGSCFVRVEELDDDDGVKIVPLIIRNNNNYYNVVSDCESNNEVNRNPFDEIVSDEVEETPRTLSIQKWLEQQKSCKLHTMRAPTKLSKKQLKTCCKKLKCLIPSQPRMSPRHSTKLGVIQIQNNNKMHEAI